MVSVFIAVKLSNAAYMLNNIILHEVERLNPVSL